MEVNLLFHSVIFLGSFLLFQIQPMAARQLLPTYGGSAAVWSTCMLFFQLLLLLGYAYSHRIHQTRPLPQMILHSLFLLLVAVFLPESPASLSNSGLHPVSSLLLSLSLGIGPAFLLLSTTSPLIQSWAARCSLPHPYQLYTTSNIASLAALLSYPFLVEPYFTLGEQFIFWKKAFVVFAFLCLGTGWAVLKFGTAPVHQVARAKSEVTTGKLQPVIAWILWPTLGSVLLLGFTSHICRDIAVIPFLWILPLSIYLLSFILCFARYPFYKRLPCAALFLLAAVLYSLPWTGGVRAPAYLGIVVCSLALFFGVMLAHGELVRLKPDTSRLTSFYLCMSLGGALGGLAVTLLAPLLFRSYFELPLAMSVLATFCLLWILPSLKNRRFLNYTTMAAQAFVVAFAIVPPFMGRSAILFQDRNFYGVIKVRQSEKIIALTDGRIEHGNMYRDPARQLEPLGYYSRNSGVGQALQSFPEGRTRKVGVIGVGAGTVCAYARPGDEWWLFELNPAVRTAAQDYFHFIGHLPPPYHFLLGDGRQQLRLSAQGDFDLLMLDAFSSDSVPVHLLTREAFQLYLARLKPDGLIAVHITNGHINFEPLMAALAASLDLQVQIVNSGGDSKERYPSSYAIFSRTVWAPIPGEASLFSTPSLSPGIRLWTDDYSNLFQLIKSPF